jgi:hypothetical protein
VNCARWLGETSEGRALAKEGQSLLCHCGLDTHGRGSAAQTLWRGYRSPLHPTPDTRHHGAITLSARHLTSGNSHSLGEPPILISNGARVGTNITPHHYVLPHLVLISACITSHYAGVSRRPSHTTPHHTTPHHSLHRHTSRIAQSVNTPLRIPFSTSVSAPTISCIPLTLLA